ncbi:MAG: DNA methyltransferase [Cyanobacteria bacterium P01_F01_bin.150]
MPRTLAYEPHNALNAICPYFTMFPLEYPLQVLEEYKEENPVVMDPFCGRGTTLFAARQLGFTAHGIDSSPVAVAIARAKLCNIDIDKTLDLAQEYIEADQVKNIPDAEFFRLAFSTSVLKQICAIRNALLSRNRDSNTSVLLRAAMLGCLHGPISKRPITQAYFSNQMPRTFSTKPDYSIRYWKEKALKPPEINVISVLTRKLRRIQQSIPLKRASFFDARLGDSRFAKSIPTSKRNFSVVVTSPPYYGMRTYVEDQWLRNWFLGGPPYVEYGKTEQIQHTGKDVFAKSLGSVWQNMARTHHEDLNMYIRFGTLPSVKTNPKSLIHASLEESGVTWRLQSISEAATAASGRRQANHMTATSTSAMEYDFHVYRV